MFKSTVHKEFVEDLQTYFGLNLKNLEEILSRPCNLNKPIQLVLCDDCSSNKLHQYDFHIFGKMVNNKIKLFVKLENNGPEEEVILI